MLVIGSCTLEPSTITSLGFLDNLPFIKKYPLLIIYFASLRDQTNDVFNSIFKADISKFKSLS